MLNRLNAGGSNFTVTNYNANIDSFENQSVYFFGRGVVSGLALSAGTGLELDVSSGVLNSRSFVTLSATSENVPDDQTSYVWIDEEGTITFSASYTYPGGNVVCLGTVTAASGSISGTATTGRMTPFLVRTDDLNGFKLGNGVIQIDPVDGHVGFGKTPAEAYGFASAVTIDASINLKQTTDPSPVSNQLLLYTKDVSGTAELFMQNESGTVTQLTSGGYLRDRAVSVAVNTETLAADKTGASTDARVQVLTPSGADRKYILPAAAMGVTREIHNGATADSNDILVRDPTDTNTLATLTNGQRVVITPRIGGSYGASAAYETSYTPD